MSNKIRRHQITSIILLAVEILDPSGRTRAEWELKLENMSDKEFAEFLDRLVNGGVPLGQEYDELLDSPIVPMETYRDPKYSGFARDPYSRAQDVLQEIQDLLPFTA